MLFKENGNVGNIGSIIDALQKWNIIYI